VVVEIKTPLSQEPAKYLSTLLSAVQCAVMGFCVNWASLFVVKAMSGRVRLKYWRLPTSARCLVGDGRRSSKSLSNLYVADNGVDAIFVSAMPDLCSRSVIYFLWEMNMPAVEGITSTPKK